MSRYRVVFEGQQRDTSRVDAWQVRLRVYKDDRYFQFVVAVVAGIDVVVNRVQEEGLAPKFWWAVAKESVVHIKSAISDRLIPLPKPTNAFEVIPSASSAARRARGTEAKVAREGDTIEKFNL